MNVDIFEKEHFSLQFFSSLLQVYLVYRVSFIFHLNAFLVPVTREFAHLFCWPRRRGIGLVCTLRFSFHEFYNFFLFIFVNFYFFFFKTFHTHPRPTTSIHYPRHLVTLQLNGLWLTKQNRNIVLSALKGVHFRFPNYWDLLYFVRFGGPWYVIRLLPSSRGRGANIPEKPCYERPVFALFFSFHKIHEVCWIRLPL